MRQDPDDYIRENAVNVRGVNLDYLAAHGVPVDAVGQSKPEDHVGQPRPGSTGGVGREHVADRVGRPRSVGGRVGAGSPTVGSVTYRLPTPPSANDIWRAVVVKGVPRLVKSSAYRRWLRQAALAVRAQGVVAVPSPVTILVELTGIDERRDGDNFLKPSIDLLRLLRVIENDTVLHVRESTARYLGPGDLLCAVTVKRVAAA